MLSAGKSLSDAYVSKIEENADDGTEVNYIWYDTGYASWCNTIGRSFAKHFISGMRFHLPELEQGQVVKYARLRLPAQGGHVNSRVSLIVRGIAEDSPEPLSAERLPSGLPKTAAGVEWDLLKEWEFPGYSLALYYSSPNIAPVINELLARPGWGSGPEGKTIVLTIEESGCPSGQINMLYFEDYGFMLRERDTALLEVFPAVGDAFVAPPILGRPAATSVTLNALNLLSLDYYLDVGTEPGRYDYYTIPVTGQPAGEPFDYTLYGLAPDTEYFYRLRYREAGNGPYAYGREARFHTQRAGGESFTFTIQADAQIHDALHDPEKYERGTRLYGLVLANALQDSPDFHIDMGDFASTELMARDAWTDEEALERYLTQRRLIGELCHSAPFFLVLGNHEGEQGWRALNDSDSLEIRSTRARKAVVPNPSPCSFYSGSQDTTPGCGLRENYYAWTWGDALFVVLDPFWYTMAKPHNYFDDGYTGSNDAWDWTLGKEQYDWLYETLHASNAQWKFVFSHHMTGGVMSGGMFPTPYGRGGIEAARFAVDSLPTYEWGGENASGQVIYDVKRPGWSHGSVHDILVSEGVDIFFHGHDHCFVHQELDGVVYQTCPVPYDPEYSSGFLAQSNYTHGVIHNNSGHLRVGVYPGGVKVDYVRAVLPEDEPLYEGPLPVLNSMVSYTYFLGDAGVSGGSEPARQTRLLYPSPNPTAGEVTVRFRLASPGPVRIEVFDSCGRLVRVVLDETLLTGVHCVPWDGRTAIGGPASPGVYYCRLRAGEYRETCKIALLR